MAPRKQPVIIEEMAAAVEVYRRREAGKL